MTGLASVVSCELFRPLRLTFECCLAKTCLNIWSRDFCTEPRKKLVPKKNLPKIKNQEAVRQLLILAITQPSARQTLVPQPGQPRPSAWIISGRHNTNFCSAAKPCQRGFPQRGPYRRFIKIPGSCDFTANINAGRINRS